MNDTARERATALITFADGLEQGGFEDYAQRARVVARDVLELSDQLDAERSARKAIQEARDRAYAILASHAGEAAMPGAPAPAADTEPPLFDDEAGANGG